MIKKIKYFLLGHYIQNPQIKLAKKWFGGKYGGFYVHPSELNENSTLNNKNNKNSILVDALNLPLSNGNEEKVKTTQVSTGRITVATIFAPIYISSLGDGSGIDGQFKDNPASGNSSYSYGVKFTYRLNSRRNLLDH